MKKRLNNKGFTLIELLAVFVILLSVSFVAVDGIISSLEKRDVKECREQHELAISAAKMYFSLDGKGHTSVSVGDLKNADYIKKKAERLDDDDVITFVNTGYLYNNKNIDTICGS